MKGSVCYTFFYNLTDVEVLEVRVKEYLDDGGDHDREQGDILGVTVAQVRCQALDHAL